MSKIKIEILSIGDSVVYSIGAIVVQPKGDAVHVDKSYPRHQTRHASGVSHFRRDDGVKFTLKHGQPLKDFKGIEFLVTRYKRLQRSFT